MDLVSDLLKCKCGKNWVILESGKVCLTCFWKGEK